MWRPKSLIDERLKINNYVTYDDNFAGLLWDGFGSLVDAEVDVPVALQERVHPQQNNT